MSQSASESGEKAKLDPSEIHDVLQNDRRRLAIECLRNSENGQLSVRDLSERVATLETGEDPAPRDKRQSVYVSLHQTHLPKLDGLGIIEYDSDAKVVTLRERVREVAVYMEVVPRYALSWAEYYFALGLLGMLTSIAALIGVPAVEALGITIVASGFFVLFMLSATYQVYRQQDRLVFSRIWGDRAWERETDTAGIDGAESDAETDDPSDRDSAADPTHQ